MFLRFNGKKIINELNLKKIIVSSNLNETVNKLENNKNYKAKRYMVECQARIIIGKDNEKYIVFSDFWNNFLDQNLRFFFFSHEIYHLFNDIILPKIVCDGTSKSKYLVTLYNIYNEYSANRFSIDIFKKPLDEKLKNCFTSLYDGYFIPLQNPDTFYKPLKLEILKFRIGNIDINEFFKRSSVFIEPIYIYLSYIFAYKESLCFIEEKFNKSDKDLFINKYTYNLFNKIRIWYERKEKINFEDGLEEIKEFLSSLSISFQDTSQGLYINVLDI